MPQASPLLTAASFQPAQPAPSPGSAPPPRPKAPSGLHSALIFCSAAILATALSSAAIWWFTREPSTNPSADTFLWLTGQDKTWDEYLSEREAAGRKLDEDEHNWMQQLVNDAYAN